jgi:3-oxoacyl-[acyl-carrier-protein] synthase-3
MRATISALAHHVPADVLPNEHYARLGVDDAWIRERTGIRERRFARDGGTSDLIVPAARACLERAGRSPKDIDCVVVATMTPDRPTPPTSALVQGKLGITGAWGFDLNAACCGFLNSLVTAASIVEAGAARRLLLCAADLMTRVADMEDPKTAPLFGDGAAVLLIEGTETPDVGVLDHVLRTDPAGETVLVIPAGGSARPATAETVARREHCLLMDGRTVFRAAVPGFVEIVKELLDRNQLTSNDVDWLVPHQANYRIIEAAADRLHFPMSKVMVNIDRFGNTSAATIPMCLAEWHDAGKIRPGDRLVLCSFGAGYMLGAVYVRWGLG